MVTRISQSINAAGGVLMETTAVDISRQAEFGTSSFTLIGPKTDRPTPTSSTRSSGGILSWARRRVSGFDMDFAALVSPALEGKNNAVAAAFFERKLSLVTREATRYPAAAVKIIEDKSSNNPAAGLLLRVACSDSHALAQLKSKIDSGNIAVTPGLVRCAACVAKERALEGGEILDKMFIKGDLDSRVTLLRSLVKRDGAGDKESVGNCFMQIQGMTTSAERREIVHPALIEMACREVASRNVRGGFLLAMISGWREEAPHEFHPEQAARLKNPLA